MSETATRLAASTFYYINLILTGLSAASYLIGATSYSNIPHIVTTIMYAGLVIYWRFWYLFALPAFYLGQKTYSSRRRLMLTGLTVLIILVIKILYGYQLPD